jgi:hypothetical protein
MKRHMNVKINTFLASRLEPAEYPAAVSIRLTIRK